MKKKWLILCVAMMMMCGAALAAGEESPDSALKRIDMTAWQYEEEHDVYWQVGIPYASHPVDAAYRGHLCLLPWVCPLALFASDRPVSSLSVGS